MRRSINPGLLVFALSTLPVAGAHAQTANSSPTAPANGSAGAPPMTSTTAPSGGATVPKAATSTIVKQTPTEQAEQRKSDKDMNICKGC